MSNDTLSCIISINLQAFYDPFVFQHHPNQSMNPFQKANSPAIPHIYGERAAQKDIRCCLLRPQINHTRTETPRNPPKNISPPPLAESNSVLFVQPGLIAINKSWSGFIATWAGARFRMAFSVPMMTMPDGSDRRRWWLWQSYKSHPENPSSPDMVDLGGLKSEYGIIHEKMDKFLCSSTKIKSEKNLKYIENNGIWWEQYKSITLLKIDIPSRRE